MALDLSGDLEDYKNDNDNLPNDIFFNEKGNSRELSPIKKDIGSPIRVRKIK